MNKKETILPFMVIGLTILFAGICVAVFLTKGKSKKWIARKIKIGGILLTLTAASCNGGGGEVMCYDVAETNSMWLPAASEKGIEINLDTNNVLTGNLYSIQGNDFSFAVKDLDNKYIQQGKMLPADGSFDTDSEDFKLELDKNLQAGDYQLNLYDCGIDGQDTSYVKRNFKLVIKDE